MSLISKVQLELFTTSEEVALKIYEDCLKVGCCIWCSIRILGEKRCCMYNKQTYQELLSISENKANNGTKTCPVCLGILQNYCLPAFFQQINDVIEHKKFDFVDYQCSLVVPVSTIVRQHSIYLHLKETFSNVYSKIPEDEISSIKEVWKWICGPDLSTQIHSTFNPKSPFEVSLIFEYDDSEKECNFLMSTNPNEFQRRKKSSYEIFTRAAVYKSVSCLPDELFKKYFQSPCLSPVKDINCDISCNYEPIYIAGRYNKYSRKLSQTPWLIDGERKTKSSVEEEICNCLTAFQASEFRFSSSGREDVDVRMLGNGRPFVVEIMNSRRYTQTKNLHQMQKEINFKSDIVKVRDLQLVSREDTVKLQEGEGEKNKCYLALCWSAEPLTPQQIDILDNTTELEVHQKTPLRVLHRRSQAVRPKMVYNMKVEDTRKNYFKLSISTQAGTYIKEFIHGDFGRTVPNISSLVGVECDILTLDVAKVDLDWPPHIEDLETKQ